MHKILLINPNTSQATTDMMVSIAQAGLPAGFAVYGITARQGVAMITTQPELDDSEAQVEDCWNRAGADCAGVIVACFGDPGLQWLRGTTTVPVVGICEAAVLDAATSGRRFGIVTTTPDLAPAMQARVELLGLDAHFTGIRLTAGDAHTLVADRTALHHALAAAVTYSIGTDHAQAVIIGGGPLGQAAQALAPHFNVPLIAPITCAVKHMVAAISAISTTEGTPA